MRPFDSERKCNVVNFIALVLFGVLLWLLINGGA